MITALLVTCLPVCRALGKYSQVARESVHSSHCKLLPVSRFCRLQACGLKSHLPGDCLSNQGRGITVGTAHIIKNPAWKSRNGVRGLEGDFRGVRGCTSTSRAFYVQVNYFRVTDSGALSVVTEDKRVARLFSGEWAVTQAQSAKVPRRTTFPHCRLHVHFCVGSGIAREELSVESSCVAVDFEIGYRSAEDRPRVRL